VLLKVAFLVGTATEWARLITRDGLTIATNLFGTTFHALVGLHASHVIVGVVNPLQLEHGVASGEALGLRWNVCGPRRRRDGAGGADVTMMRMTPDLGIGAHPAGRFGRHKK
jgi:hypothetical protein